MKARRARSGENPGIGQTERQVRIGGENWLAGRSEAAGERKGVAAGAGAADRKPRHCRLLLIQLRQCGDAEIPLHKGGPQCRPFLAVAMLEELKPDRPIGIGRRQAGDRRHVLEFPRISCSPEQCQLVRQLTQVPNVMVEAAYIGVEPGERRLRHD